MRVDSAKHIAKGKGVLGDEESEGSRWQTPGLTNRNHIRQCKLGKVAEQTEVNPEGSFLLQKGAEETT